MFVKLMKFVCCCVVLEPWLVVVLYSNCACKLIILC